METLKTNGLTFTYSNKIDPASPLRGEPGNRFAIDPSDPMHAVVQAFEGVQKQAFKEMSVLVTKLSDEVAASSVLAEKAARAKAEQVISEAGVWAADQIRVAGAEAAQATRREEDTLTILVSDVHRAINVFYYSLMFAGGMAGALALAIVWRLI